MDKFVIRQRKLQTDIETESATANAESAHISANADAGDDSVKHAQTDDSNQIQSACLVANRPNKPNSTVSRSDGRKYQSTWKAKYTWLQYDESTRQSVLFIV
jgi:hypothetical protein